MITLPMQTLIPNTSLNIHAEHTATIYSVCLTKMTEANDLLLHKDEALTDRIWGLGTSYRSDLGFAIVDPTRQPQAVSSSVTRSKY
jgi:hypothetical protein